MLPTVLMKFSFVRRPSDNTVAPRRSLTGFTLIELLVVISIIGTLATLVLIQLGTARGRARDAKRISDVNQLRSAVELYYEDNNGKYPDEITPAELGKYLTQVPHDPLDQTQVYGYKLKENVKKLQYHIWTELEQKALGALNADSDIDSTQWNGPGSARGGVDGRSETCVTNDINDGDCIYDQGVNQ